MVVTWPSLTLNACCPKTSLVENSTIRSIVSRRLERRLERVVRADHVDPHGAHRAREDGVDAGDRSGVHEVRAALDQRAELVTVENVGLLEVEVRMGREIGARQRIAVEVVHRDDLVVVDQTPGEGRPDEPRPAGDHDPLAGE